jgi:hypothetical protein
MVLKSLLCHLFTGHDWQRLRTEDDLTYLECRRCGIDGELTEAFYGDGHRRAFGVHSAGEGFFEVRRKGQSSPPRKY